MRKYRAWDKEKKFWLNPEYFYITGEGRSFTCEDYKGMYSAVYRHMGTDRYAIMQYAGREHGVEIYEDDILLYTRKNWQCWGHPKHNTDLTNRVHVYWSDERHCVRRDLYDDERCIASGGLSFEDERAGEITIEIIGNIHQHRNLLEANSRKINQTT